MDAYIARYEEGRKTLETSVIIIAGLLCDEPTFNS
jgi:hypothetical protein